MMIKLHLINGRSELLDGQHLALKLASILGVDVHLVRKLL